MSNKSIREKIAEGREYRNFQPIFPAGKKVVEGYASTFGEPFLLWKIDNYEVWEKVDPHAFDECDLSDVIMQYDHEGRVFARGSNGTLTVEPDKKGLAIRADLGGTALGAEIHHEIEGGYTTKMSIGFAVKTVKREVEENVETGEVKVLRTILKMGKLYDVSAVSLPANDATSISARHIGEGVIEEVRKELQLRKQRDRQKQKIRILLEETR